MAERPADTGEWLVDGHVHETWLQSGRQVNVGIDAWGGGRVANADEVVALMKSGPRELRMAWSGLLSKRYLALGHRGGLNSVGSGGEGSRRVLLLCSRMRTTNNPAEAGSSLAGFSRRARQSPVPGSSRGRRTSDPRRDPPWHQLHEGPKDCLANWLAASLWLTGFLQKPGGCWPEGRVAWLDRRRGHLQLRGTALLIDADVPPLIGPEPTRVADPFVPTGLDVGMALLLDPEHGHRTTELATLIGRSPGRVSEILGALRDRELGSDRTGRPSIPELFNEMADAWTPAWRPLGKLPGLDSDLYRLSGTLGAVWHQAPVVATADWPAELYVESQGELRSGALCSHGVTPGTPSAGRVAVCPSRYGWSVPARLPEHDFPVANHIVQVALDLAQDRGRGREILDGWNPEGHVRVW